MLLTKLISPVQSAFVTRRLITNNTMVAFELIHHMNNTGRGKVGEVAMNIDISKVYDQVN